MALHQAAERLWGESPPQNRETLAQSIPQIRQTPGTSRYAYLVLELRCFNHFFRPRRLSDIWEEEAFLPGSRTEHYRDFDLAVKALGDLLLTQLRPTFRPEQPQLQNRRFGYQEIQKSCQSALEAGQTVALFGAGGMGKTSLGMVLAATPSLQPAFWFTVRPSFNDQLSSLLFSLGHFLHQQGASNLWKLLLAGGEKTHDLHLALGLVREDLHTLRSRDKSPLLCFDELDRLRSADLDQMSAAHTQLLEFIEALEKETALLQIGQRPVLEADHYQELTGLQLPHIQALLDVAEIPYITEDSTHLYHFTKGNPRLLILFLALYQEEKSLTQLIAELPHSPTVQPLLNRLWPRLAAGERRLLQRLSVFRSPAPSDGWPQDLSALENLIHRRLIENDGRGGIFLLPALQTLIYAELLPERRDSLHQEAATVRLARGEYTAATYHYLQAGLESQAVQLWYAQRAQEVQRGQAEAALSLFQGISQNRLGKRERQALGELRAELHLLQGNVDKGLAELEAMDWSSNDELAVRVQSLKGDFLRSLGYPDAAIKGYGEGITVLSRLLAQLTRFRCKRGMAHIRQREQGEAWQEAQFAQYETQSLLGVLHSEEGAYSEAHTAHQSALAIAQKLDHKAGIAQTHRNLAILLGRQQKLDAAIDHAKQAMSYYEQIGDRVQMEVVRSNLSALHFSGDQFKEAIAVGEQALPILEAINDPYLIANTKTNLAAAYFECGDFAQAQQHAMDALGQEERQAHSYALYTLGQIKQAEDSLVLAIEHLSYGIKSAQLNGDRYIEAYIQRMLGSIYLKQGQQEQGVSALTIALQIFKELRIAFEVAETEALLP